MKNNLIYYLFITLSIFLNSCSEGFKEKYLKISVVLAEVTAITTPTTDTTPSYTFSSNQSGTITYGGSCSSSTASAISGNNTITLNSLSDGTYADCTIKVSKTISTEKSEKKLSGSLTITSFTVSSSGWQLIARQADITVQSFNSNASSTYLENEDDDSSSTFMSIGNLTNSNYVTDGKYKFKLVWGGGTVETEVSIKQIIWTQTSWLTDTTVQGFLEIEEGTSGYTTASFPFVGLLKSSLDTLCVLDGNQGRGWWHCVGQISGPWHGGIPGPEGKIATSMHLYIWEP